MLVSSAPRWIHVAGEGRRTLPQLLGRDAEMRALSKLGLSMRTLPAAVWPGDMREALAGADPHKIVFSGHFHKNGWLSEADEESREAKLVTGRQIAHELLS